MEKIKMQMVYQIGMVVADAEAVFANFDRVFEVTDIQHVDTRDPVHGFKNWTRWGKPAGEYNLKVVLFTMGNLQFELIQPLNESGDPYSDWLKAQGGKGGLHHILPIFEQGGAMARELLIGAGNVESHTGTLMGGSYWYIDAYEKLNLLIEGF